MSLKIKNIDNLRDHVLETFEKLSSGKIDIAEAGIIAKLSETVISGLKTQMEYSRLTETKPDIPFIGDFSKQPKLIEGKKIKQNQIEHKNNKSK